MINLADIQEVFQENISPHEQEIQEEFKRIQGCGKSYIELMGMKTANEYYKRIDCEKWFCRDCGGIDGKVHKKRKKTIMNHFGGVEGLKSAVVAQWVFTIPKNVRFYFQNRNALNAVFRMVKRIIERKYGKGSLSVYYLHLFGDKNFTFHPHVNVHIKLNDNDLGYMKISEIESLREQWRKAIEGYVREKVPVVDISYSYRKGVRKILHSVKYMSRPLDADCLYAEDEIKEMRYWLIVKMKKFRFVRTYGGDTEMRDEGDFLKEIKELEGAAGEPLRFVRILKASELQMKYRDNDLEKVADGLYRVVKNKR